MICVDPEQLDLALQSWNEQFAEADEGLAADGNTMRNAIDEEGRQTHILGVVGHQTRLSKYSKFKCILISRLMASSRLNNRLELNENRC